MMSPSSSSLRLLVGLERGVVFTRLDKGSAARISSSGAWRLREIGVAGRGVASLSIRGGLGSGEGKMNAGASTG
jgi:hypothetical protein